MSLDAYETSAGLFIHGLNNLKTLLKKAEAHIAAHRSSEAVLLDAQLAAEGVRGVASHPHDVHMYTLAAQVHWAAEGAKLAVAHMLGAPAVPAASDEKSIADLYQRLDATIAYLREIAPSALDAALARWFVIARGRGSLRFSGSQFLLEYAIPHFYYHVDATYGILRNQGVHLTMGDLLGNVSRASVGP
jgi:hypothetical protein